jgi:hypothetical protein
VAGIDLSGLFRGLLGGPERDGAPVDTAKHDGNRRCIVRVEGQTTNGGLTEMDREVVEKLCGMIGEPYEEPQDCLKFHEKGIA